MSIIDEALKELREMRGWLTKHTKFILFNPWAKKCMLSDSEERISLHHRNTFKVDVKNTFELEQEIKKHLRIAYIDKSGKEITQGKVWQYDGSSYDAYFKELIGSEYIKFDFQYNVEDIIKENLPEFTCIGKVEWVITEWD